MFNDFLYRFVIDHITCYYGTPQLSSVIHFLLVLSTGLLVVSK